MTYVPPHHRLVDFLHKKVLLGRLEELFLRLIENFIIIVKTLYDYRHTSGNVLLQIALMFASQPRLGVNTSHKNQARDK